MTDQPDFSGNELPEAYENWADAPADPPEPTPAEHKLLAVLRERGTRPERVCDLIASADALDALFTQYQSADLGTIDYSALRPRWDDGARAIAHQTTAIFGCGDPDPDADPQP